MLRNFKKTSHSIQTGDQHPYWETPLILVSGFGRSGTTILRKCIAAHHQIDCADRESNIIYDLLKLGRETREDKNRKKNLAVGQKEYWLLFRQMILNLTWPVRDIQRETPARAIATFSAMSPVSAIGLAKTFPQHQILWIVRNGIEVVSSRANFQAFNHASFRDICDAWQTSMQMLEYERKWGNLTLFRHEWFADEAKTSAGLQPVLEKFGLDFDESCAKVAQTTREHPTKIAGEAKSAREDLTRRSERWKYWTDEQRTIFADECSEGMRELGYDIPWL